MVNLTKNERDTVIVGTSKDPNQKKKIFYIKAKAGGFYCVNRVHLFSHSRLDTRTSLSAKLNGVQQLYKTSNKIPKLRKLNFFRRSALLVFIQFNSVNMWASDSSCLFLQIRCACFLRYSKIIVVLFYAPHTESNAIQSAIAILSVTLFPFHIKWANFLSPFDRKGVRIT